MDFLIEFIMGVLFEAPLEATMESKRVKTWIKTALFVILGAVVEALFIFSAYSVCFNNNDPVGSIILWILSVGWAAFITWGAIYGHKRKWKQDK